MKKLGPRYMKSLRALEKGPLNILDKAEIVRYRNLEDQGLCKGTGVRVVGLTAAGRLAIQTGLVDDSDAVTMPPIGYVPSLANQAEGL